MQDLSTHPSKNHPPKHPPHHHHLPTTYQQPASSLACCASFASLTSKHFISVEKWTSRCFLSSQECLKNHHHCVPFCVLNKPKVSVCLNCASSPAAANFVCRSSFKASPWIWILRRLLPSWLLHMYITNLTSFKSARNRIADSELLPSHIVMQQGLRRHSVPPSGRSCFEVPQAVLWQPSMTTNWIIFPGIRVEINKTCFRYLPIPTSSAARCSAWKKILHCKKVSMSITSPQVQLSFRELCSLKVGTVKKQLSPTCAVSNFCLYWLSLSSASRSKKSRCFHAKTMRKNVTKRYKRSTNMAFWQHLSELIVEFFRKVKIPPGLFLCGYREAFRLVLVSLQFLQFISQVANHLTIDLFQNGSIEESLM